MHARTATATEQESKVRNTGSFLFLYFLKTKIPHLIRIQHDCTAQKGENVK